MTGRTALRALSRAIEVLLVVVAVALFVGYALGQPVLLGYVETGSMQPALQPADGFVAIPAVIAGEIKPGDVVVYNAEYLHGGGLTTHRVVGVTDQGYITRGDANVFTDQAVGEPPVQRSQIVAKALAVNGQVVVVPGLGSLTLGVRDTLADVQRALADVGVHPRTTTRLASLLAIAGVLFYALSLYRERTDAGVVDGDQTDRGLRNRLPPLPREIVVHPAVLVAILCTLLVLAATAGMVLPSGPQTIEIISADNDASGPRVVQKGTTESTAYPVVNPGFVPVVVVLTPVSQELDVQPRELVVDGRERVDATLAISALPEIGYYRYSLVEHRYLAVLPLPALRALYAIHPWLPIVAIDALLAAGAAVLGFLLVGTTPIRLQIGSLEPLLRGRMRRRV